jgi:hypothetical protein
MPGTQAVHDQVLREHKEFKPMPIKQINTRETEGRTRRYISLFEGLDARLPIMRVIVGPSRHQDENLARARNILGNNIALTPSATPFIG